MAESEERIAVGIEFAEQPGAETAGIEEPHHGHVVPVAVSAVSEELLALCFGQQFHGASSGQEMSCAERRGGVVSVPAARANARYVTQRRRQGGTGDAPASRSRPTWDGPGPDSRRSGPQDGCER